MRNTKPYMIAEMGVNFYDTAKAMGISPLDAAKLYIDKAAEAGVDCAKFQSYKADTIMNRQIICMIWWISIRYLLPIFLTFHLLNISEVKGNQCICQLERLTYQK